MTVAGSCGSARAAEESTMSALLNCYLRETLLSKPGGLCEGAHTEGDDQGEVIRCRLDYLGVEFILPLQYRSVTGRHLFRFPAWLVVGGEGKRVELDHVTLAALIAKELSLWTDGGADLSEFVLRVLDSARQVALFVREAPQSAPATSPFLASEQSLALGHPLHPAPKSRQGMSADEVRRFAPELGARFPLRWFLASRSIIAEDSALARPASDILRDTLVADLGLDSPLARRLAGESERVLVPTHPWQGQRLLTRSDVRELIDARLLEDLGECGGAWSPTSSVRTLYRADSEIMLKLSLGVAITNSVRQNLRKELVRGAEVHRLLETELGSDLLEHFPTFNVIRDPAWITLEVGRGRGESGFETILRENPYGAGTEADATLVAGLGQERADGGPSRIARLVSGLARTEQRPVETIARDWFGRYLRIALDPLLWLYGRYGVALEAHQQNSVLELCDGYPARFRYRDNQGYYFKQSHSAHLAKLLPGIGAESDTVCDDSVADERFGYYLFVNNLFGLVNAFGVAGLADEGTLLCDLAERLAAAPQMLGHRLPIVEKLLTSERLRCKGNMLTRLHDMDELEGPLATQSVYVEIENPLVLARRA